MTTVLVVDDSAWDRRHIGSLLQRAGFEVIFAENGRHALDLLGQNQVDIVVTDLQMPELDGLELVEAVRLNYPALPVLLMTAHGSEDIAVKALQRGAANYVPKHSIKTELVPTVKSVLEVTQTEGIHDDIPEHYVLDIIEYTETKYVLPNEVAVIRPLISYLEANLTRMKIIDGTALIQIGMALREAIVNAMHHGNLEVPSALREDTGKAYFELIEERKRALPYSERRVRLTARETRSEVTYVVVDEGPGFDPSSLPDPTDLLQLEKVGGRGLLLIRTFMDEVHHNAQGNEITMVKYLDERAATFDDAALAPTSAP
jgi:CheY-like chemotaxis protein